MVLSVPGVVLSYGQGIWEVAAVPWLPNWSLGAEGEAL